jgi:Na+-transporting methylmalonyl-CoA/oxaloacetate decarboxylase beta subunit
VKYKAKTIQVNLQYVGCRMLTFIIAIGAFIIMISLKYVEEPIWVKPVLHGVLLIGLLRISLSKEKIEDELIDSLRSQSYRLAFILAIVYSLVQPLVNYGVGTLLNQDDELQDFSCF